MWIIAAPKPAEEEMDAKTIADIASDPQGFKKRLAEFEAATKRSAETAEAETAAAEAARRERAAADARVKEAEALMAGVKAAEAALAQERMLFANHVRDRKAELKAQADELTAREKAQDEAEQAMQRRTVSANNLMAKLAAQEKKLAEDGAALAAKLEKLRALAS